MVGWGTSYHGRNIQQMYSFHCKYSRQMLLPHTQFIYIWVYSLTLSGMHRITALCTMHTSHTFHTKLLFSIFFFFVLFFYHIFRLHAVQYNLVSNQNTHEINTQQRKKQKKKKTNKHKTDSDTQAQYTIFHTQYFGAADLCFYVCCRRRCGESIRVFRLCDLAPYNK